MNQPKKCFTLIFALIINLVIYMKIHNYEQVNGLVESFEAIKIIFNKCSILYLEFCFLIKLLKLQHQLFKITFQYMNPIHTEINKIFIAKNKKQQQKNI